jgi:hypothetical protein
MADAAMREVVYEIVTRVVAPAAISPQEVERCFDLAARSVVRGRADVSNLSIEGARIEKVRVVSMYVRREAADVAQAG